MYNVLLVHLFFSAASKHLLPFSQYSKTFVKRKDKSKMKDKTVKVIFVVSDLKDAVLNILYMSNNKTNTTKIQYLYLWN